MRMVYTNENAVLVNHAKNILENEGISTFVKNEQAATGGHVNFALMELWITIDEDLQQANDLLAPLTSAPTGKEWQCSNCEEKNDASFDICWKCGNEAPE